MTLPRLRNLPLRQKLLVIGIATSGAALLVTSVVFLISSYLIVRGNLQTGVGVQTSIVADSANYALSFRDPKVAGEALAAMRASPVIDLGCLYTVDGALLATYVRRGAEVTCPPTAPADGNLSGATYVAVAAPVAFGDRRVGTVLLRANLTRVTQQIRAQSYAALLGLVIGVAVVLLVAARLRRVISEPVLALSTASERIARAGDYSIRAAKHGEDEIGALTDAFNEMVAGIERRDEQLRTASRLKDEFLAALSHELRTPLNAIVGWLQILRTSPDNPPLRERALNSLDRNARAQARLIEDLLDVSRIVTGKLQLNTAVVDLVTVIDAALDVIRPAASAKGITVERDLLPSPRLVAGDADRLQQVVWNLLSNAVKFTPSGGRVDVSLTEAAASYTITVRDTGIGIPPEFLPRMFDRFLQADGSTTRQHGGLGLGLAIVRDLVVMHGGRVEASSAGPGHGATFSVVLPQLLTSRAPAGGVLSPSETRLDGLSVLVVDDDPEARDVAAAALTGAGAVVCTAADAQAALGQLELEDFDALVCDIAMPDVDGYTLLRRIRALELERGRFLPAVALTAYASADDQARAHAVGYQGFVSKPFEFSALVTAVGSAAGRV